jgi:hypothetical protein
LPGQGKSANKNAKNTEPATTASKVNLAFTDCPFVDLTEQPGRVTPVLTHASDVAICCFVERRQGDKLEAS